MDANQSQISAYLETVRSALQSDVDGVGEVLIYSERNLQDAVKRSAQIASGRSVMLVLTGATLPDAMSTQAQVSLTVQVEDNQMMGKTNKQHIYEVLEGIITCLHNTNQQELKAACKDSAVSGFSLAGAGDQFDIYTIDATATIHFTPPQS